MTSTTTTIEVMSDSNAVIDVEHAALGRNSKVCVRAFGWMVSRAETSSPPALWPTSGNLGDEIQSGYACISPGRLMGHSTTMHPTTTTLKALHAGDEIYVSALFVRCCGRIFSRAAFFFGGFDLFIYL